MANLPKYRLKAKTNKNGLFLTGSLSDVLNEITNRRINKLNALMTIYEKDPDNFPEASATEYFNLSFSLSSPT